MENSIILTLEMVGILKKILKKHKKPDEIKNEYAFSHGIDLVRIPYWERDNITLNMLLGNQYLVMKT